MTDVAYVALGSNLGNRAAFLAAARAAISLVPGLHLLAASTVEETAPLGTAPQGPYLNQMIVLASRLAPLELLGQLHAIERGLGRVRTVRWGPRTIDLDIVHIDGRRCEDSALRLPHPGLSDRTFWQREMAELQRMMGRAA